MSVFLIIGAVLVLGIAAYVLARYRALASANRDSRLLHSLPRYYGWHGFIMVVVPSLLLLAAWLIAQPLIIEQRLNDILPAEMVETEANRALVMEGVRRLASGLDIAVARGALSYDEMQALRTDTTDVRALLATVGVALGGEVQQPVLDAARAYLGISETGTALRGIIVLAAAFIGFGYALAVTNKDFRARNRVENVVLALLILASTIAILTTVGIVFSLVSEAGRFFTMYPIQDFFFGTVWSPSTTRTSSFGLLPLLWGTLYISFIAMVVAVPIGIFTAIYLAEYASPRVRSIIKPTIEVIAGIPTVVFGLFAMVTVGPYLRDYFAQPLGLGTSASSVMTAGLVIGVLNIPFISSLADDIINAVPQSLRDGSYGLGATQSETVRQVVLPAALPGIVGAALMACSRAIGETMIVTMGAGAAAQMDLNPFEAMTTITVKIVGQLTGDNAFDSPETLVAFALGITLFVLTLCLNIFALWIVRRYREQYE